MSELNDLLAIAVYETKYADLSLSSKIEVDQLKTALQSLILGAVPKEEAEENLCHCEFDGNPYIDEKENLVKCKDCQKQIGHKLWNFAITETKSKIEELFK